MRDLYDTSVIVEHLRGNTAASDHLHRQEIHCSVITAAELIQGVENARDQRVVEKILARIFILPLTPAIGNRMLVLVRTYHLSHNLSIPDALIAATALEHGLILVTHNTKHFSFIPTLSVRAWKDVAGEKS